MSDNRTYRIRTEVGKDKSLNINLNQDYDLFEILSLKISTDSLYKLHTANYGCIVGRVLANGGVGIPNAKLSVFIKLDDEDYNDSVIRYLYPFIDVRGKDMNGVRYNTLPDFIDDKCHQDVGTFPSKRIVLDDNNVIEVFDKYFKYTTTTNASGDYMIFGIPTGENMLHCDIDLSDIGILSQKPRDFFYKGYNHTQFDSASKFKSDTNLDNLTQIITQNDSVYVYPFWGDSEIEGEGVESQVKITRNDININYKFEPTCIFIGSIVSDERSQGISKKCVATDRMGKMDRLTTGKGTIEMIRKTPEGDTESFPIQGNDLIDGNGTWCYQIPMNLDYMKTDEFGNFVPAENENTGIPTRCRVRFRVSLADYESDSANAHLVKLLVPNNPSEEEVKAYENSTGETKDNNSFYTFGSNTPDSCYRDLFWNNVYTVKEYIPRIQRIYNIGAPRIDRSRNFTGIKAVNVNGSNNPIPYNNMRIQLTFLFIFQCILFKSLLLTVKALNLVIRVLAAFKVGTCTIKGLNYITIDGSMCQNLDDTSWYFAIGGKNTGTALKNTFKTLIEGMNVTINGNEEPDEEKDVEASGGGYTSIDDEHSSEFKYLEKQSFKDGNKEFTFKLSTSQDYFVKCVELQFAMEYEVIQFDFYNDWLNGCLYIPRWFAEIRKRRKKGTVKACNDDFNNNHLSLVQQCAISFTSENSDYKPQKNTRCGESNGKCHKGSGRKMVKVFNKSGLVHDYLNLSNQHLYYPKPSEYSGKYKHLFATDIILLGNVNECNQYGIPLADGYPSSTFMMPPPTGLVVSDTQEMVIGSTASSQSFEIKTKKSGTFYPHLWTPNKIVDTSETGTSEMEISGIDWGYNPFNSGKNLDKTNIIKNQIGGHFLEIGCLFSDSNVKSCVNLQRICELGSEMSQSHYYKRGNSETVTKTTGIISGREVIGMDLRTKVASLNSNNLKTSKNTNNGYLKYDFIGYTPSSFDGALSSVIKDVNNKINGVIENKSNSYWEYRFGNNKGVFLNSYTKNNIKYNTMPLYDNSFYFYFGLKDGNTAIDRLYSEYFSSCSSTTDD